MNYEKYTEAALKTESIISEVDTNYDRLLSVINLSIAAGNMLDDLKKKIFYNKEINNDKFFKQFNDALESIHSIEVYKPGPHKLPCDQNKLIGKNIGIDSRVFHGVVGMATESTEMLEALKLYIETGKLDNVNMGEEIGDSMWYQTLLLDSTNQSLETILNTNIKKLEIRFKNQQFEEIHAKNRNLNLERKILERKGSEL